MVCDNVNHIRSLVCMYTTCLNISRCLTRRFSLNALYFTRTTAFYLHSVVHRFCMRLRARARSRMSLKPRCLHHPTLWNTKVMTSYRFISARQQTASRATRHCGIWCIRRPPLSVAVSCLVAFIFVSSNKKMCTCGWRRFVISSGRRLFGLFVCLFIVQRHIRTIRLLVPWAGFKQP